MRTSHLVNAALAALAIPCGASAIVVVRHAAYVHPVVVVAPAPVVVSSTTYYVESAPAPAPPPSTTKLPVDTTMWTLPSGCLQVSKGGQTYHQCGPNWLKPYPSDKGTYYGVIPEP
jgi:hypothetical protein